jgi:hypothetical protein
MARTHQPPEEAIPIRRFWSARVASIKIERVPAHRHQTACGKMARRILAEIRGWLEDQNLRTDGGDYVANVPARLGNARSRVLHCKRNSAGWEESAPVVSRTSGARQFTPRSDL